LTISFLFYIFNLRAIVILDLPALGTTAQCFLSRFLNMAKILLIEKGKNLMELYREIIERVGYDIVIANDGEVAFKKALAEKFIAAITDTQKPETLEFIKNIRRQPETVISTIPILVIMEDNSDSSVDYIEAGATRCLYKFPSSGEKLVSALKEIIQVVKFPKNK